MIQENEIKALIALLDDKDPEIFDHVARKLFLLGPTVIDKLEDAYVTEPNPLLQERIEDLIHKIQFDRVQKDLSEWVRNNSDDLLKGVLIVTRQQYPELDEEKIIKTISRIKKDIWIGLNNYLSPLEQVNVVNQTLFSHYQFMGLQSSDDDLHYSYLNNMTDAYKGNHFSIGLLYLILCQQLEIPMYGVRLSSHFILARTKDYLTDFADAEMIKSQVLFYINPYNKGLAFSDREINIYLKKLDIEMQEAYYLPASNKDVLKEYIQHLIRLCTKPEDDLRADDLEKLIDILEEE